jgi:hypothetical protein
MSSSRLTLLLILLCSAALTVGCSPPGAVNEKAVLDSTPHSEPAEYAKSQEDYNKHMIERYTKEKPKSIPSGKKKSR